MKLKIIAFSLIAMTFIGCGKSAFMMMDKTPEYQKALQFTEQKELRNYFETLAIVRVTYLSALEPKKYGNVPTFFVGLNIKNDFLRNKKGINNPLFSLMSNNTEITEIEEVTIEHPLYKSMPVMNRWSRYYKITFIGNPLLETMNVKFEHKASKENIVFTFNPLENFQH
jgi:hypothetical protein